MSQLRLMTSHRDNGGVLQCAASHPTNKHWTLKNSIRLSVHFAPRISVSLGSALVADKIRQGADVYFECKILANPAIYRLQWSRNGVPLDPSPSRVTGSVGRADRLMIGDRSLIIRNISRHASGTYTCSAANSEGSASSHSRPLTVKHSPECPVDSVQRIAVTLGSSTTIECDVISEPPPLRFYWLFVTNQSSEPQTLPQLVFTSSSNNSVRFTPRRRSDFGMLLCFSENQIGRMLKPCRFQLELPENRQASLNCSVSYKEKKLSTRNLNLIQNNSYIPNRSGNNRISEKEEEKQNSDDILISCSSLMFPSSSSTSSESSSSVLSSSSTTNTLQKHPSVSKNRLQKKTKENRPVSNHPSSTSRPGQRSYSRNLATPQPSLAVEVRDSSTRRLLVNATISSLVFRVPDPAPDRALSVRVTSRSRTGQGDSTLLHVLPRRAGSQHRPATEEYSTVSFTSLTSYVVGSLCGAVLSLLLLTLLAVILVKSRRANNNNNQNSIQKRSEEKKYCHPTTPAQYTDDPEEVDNQSRVTELGQRRLTSPITGIGSPHMNTPSPRPCRLIIHQSNQKEMPLLCQQKDFDSISFASSATFDTKTACSIHGGAVDTIAHAKYTSALPSHECDVRTQPRGILRNTIRSEDSQTNPYLPQSDFSEIWPSEVSPVSAIVSKQYQLYSRSAACRDEMYRLRTHCTPLLTNSHHTEHNCTSTLSPSDRESVV